MALLREVPGEPLVGETDRDQTLMASTLDELPATGEAADWDGLHDAERMYRGV